jgi:hypothetical protein
MFAKLTLATRVNLQGQFLTFFFPGRFVYFKKRRELARTGSGAYIVRMQAGVFKEIRKILFVK